MKFFQKKFFSTFFLCLLVFTLIPGQNSFAFYNTNQNNVKTTAALNASSLLGKMTPEERVGQLFLVSFNGSQIPENANILDLITNYHIGGVILKTENNNFTGPENTLSSAYDLISIIQQIEWDNSDITKIISVVEDDSIPEYVPLFIAINQSSEENILNELTLLPNQMAIGATWDTDLAYQAGKTLGSELSALGINIYIGPSLDIINPMSSEESNILGNRSFGEEPYWVAKLGQAYISGVHYGSDNQIAVVPQHFPGIGSSDRSPEQEIATVRKSLEELTTSELTPFFAVTGLASDPSQQADGLLVSHTRYEGLQGYIHPSTRPISFDTAAMEDLLSLSQLANWRSEGGIFISESLGSTAIRKFYDPTEQTFDARQTASHAFLAGNDLLILDNFLSTGDADQYVTIRRTLDFFVQKYNEDAAFAQRVDQSVERILTLKFELYPDFDIDKVVPSLNELDSIGASQNVTFQIAQKSATMLSPKANELSTVLPNAPGINDRIVIIADNINSQQCQTCASQEVFSADSIRKAITRLYGPQAGRQIMEYRISAYSFSDVIKMLDGVEDNQILEDDLRATEWVVFGFMDQSETRISATAIERLIEERPDLIRNKYSVAFAFNPPYFLDATEISNFTVYYGLYSSQPEFLDISARILFQEFIPTGASPVSIGAVGYYIKTITSPNSWQTIPLMLNSAELNLRPPENGFQLTETPPAITTTSIPTQIPSFRVGDTLPLITGVIYDNNNHPVPNGTMVKFVFSSEGIIQQQIETETTNGVAKAEYLIQETGNLEINVISEPATQSDKLALNVTEGQAAIITVIATTAQPSPTFTTTPTMMTATPTPTFIPNTTDIIPEKTTVLDWFFSLIIIGMASVGIYFLGRSRISTRWGIRWALLSIIGGLIAYIFITIKQPGQIIWIKEWGLLGFILTDILGVLLGWLCAVLWYKLHDLKIHSK